MKGEKNFYIFFLGLFLHYDFSSIILTFLIYAPQNIKINFNSEIKNMFIIEEV